MTGWRPRVLPVLVASTIFWFATTCSQPFSTIQIEPTSREAHDMVKVSDQRDFRIQGVVQVLNNDPFRTLPELAHNCQISSSRLSHLFKDEIGISVKHYRLDCRLQMAAEMLVSANRPMKEIASQRVTVTVPASYVRSVLTSGCHPPITARSS